MKELPKNPERFDHFVFVLGSNGFTSGCHSWEVDVGQNNDWVIGVVKASVARKGKISGCLEGGFWTIALSDGKYTAWPPHIHRSTWRATWKGFGWRSTIIMERSASLIQWVSHLSTHSMTTLRRQCSLFSVRGKYKWEQSRAAEDLPCESGSMEQCLLVMPVYYVFLLQFIQYQSKIWKRLPFNLLNYYFSRF